MFRIPIFQNAFLGLAGAALLAVLPIAAAQAEPADAVTARVENHTRPTACAEEDNVSLTLSGTRIARFRVEALPPAYLGRIEKDVTAPDFSNCNFDGGAHPTDPSFTFHERRVVLHDGPRWQIVGITLPTFWRPHQVPVTVAGRTANGIHLLQIFAKPRAGQDDRTRKPLEALVMYPSDGYWRIKPLPEPRFGDGVYGSSFLMGPVEQDGRPVVNIASIAVGLKPLALHLKFTDGSTAEVCVVEISQRRTALDVRFKSSPPPSHMAGEHGDKPFAVLRSMYVTPENADMSEVQWRAAPGSAFVTRALPDVATFDAADVRFGRSVPSRHNTGAPDIRFSAFAR